jgi:hypothetical protein
VEKQKSPRREEPAILLGGAVGNNLVRREIMKKILPLMAVFFMAAVLAFPPAAHATLTLYLDDNVGNTVTVVDNGVGDLIPLTTGQIAWIGPLGVWNLNITSGVSYSPATTPLAMDLNSLSGSTAAGTLTIALSDTGFNGAQLATMQIGGTAAAGGTVTYSAYYDNANVSDIPPPGSATLIHTLGGLGPGAFSDTFQGLIDTTVPFTLMEVVEITHGGAGTSSFNGNLAVPLPPTALLLGGGLLGLVALGWRRRRS